MTFTTIRRLLALASLLLLAIAAPAAPQRAWAQAPAEAVDFSPSFDIPEEVFYEHLLRVDTQQGVTEIGEQKMRTQLFRRFSILARSFEERQDDGAVAEASFLVTRVAMRVEQRNQIVFDFDSDRPRVSDPSVGNLAGQVEALRALPDLDVRVRLDPSGKAISVSGVEPLQEIAQEDEGAAIILGFIGEYWFKGMCEQIWALGGVKGAARVGETWTLIETPVVDTGQTVAMRTEYALADVVDGEALIEGSGRLDIAEGETIEIMPGADGEIINHKAAVDARWSLERGRTASFGHRFAMEVAMSMTGVDIVQIQDISQSLVEVR